MKWMSKAFVWPFLLLICGCISADIAVIELRTGEMRHPPYSGMRQVVVAVDRKAGTFKTMRRNGSLFAVRTFDAACRQVSEFNVPVFTEGYCGSTHYSLSDDGRRFVYLKDNTHNLYLLDVSTGRETLLWEHVANTELEMPQLEWISESKVLVVLREYGRSDRRTNEVTILDVATGDRKTIYSPVDPSSFDYSLSPDASLLAFQDASSLHDIQGVVKVLDVQKGTLRATLGDGHQLIGEPCWNPDG
jgi:Tol biopolymer transport system component